MSECPDLDFLNIFTVEFFSPETITLRISVSVGNDVVGHTF